jgi:hypothetical protein
MSAYMYNTYFYRRISGHMIPKDATKTVENGMRYTNSLADQKIEFLLQNSAVINHHMTDQ